MAGNDVDRFIQKPVYWKNRSINIPPRIVNGNVMREQQRISNCDGKIVIIGYLNGFTMDRNNDGVPDDWDYDGQPDKNHDTGYPYTG